MIQQCLIGSNIEIYPEIGGGYLTQSFPTLYREFWPRKMLSAGDSIDNYREATAAEKRQWEAAHPKPVEAPAQWLIDLWNNMAVTIAYGRVGRYNANTGYFELNGLTDITTSQALDIIADSTRRNVGATGNLAGSCWKGRTNMPLDLWYNATTPNNVLYGAPNMEVFILQFLPAADSGRNVGISAATIKVCSKLHTVGHRVYPAENNVKLFADCPALVNVDFMLDISARRKSFSLADCPLLSYDTIASICRHGSANSTAITVTLHPDVYAKLTGDVTNAAAAALSADELAAWGELLTDAVARNVTFATTNAN